MKKDWEIKKLGDICETGSGGTPLKGHKEYYENGTIPWLRSGEVCKKDICESELFITETGLKKSSAKLFPINTVLVAMYGATAGQTGILRFQSTTNQAVCGILPNSKLVPEFIYYFFLSYKDKLIAQAVGGAQPNISQVKICNSPIPVPPLEKQKRIVKILDEKFAQLETIKANAQTNLQSAKELFQSQLTKAFSKATWEKKKLRDLTDSSLSYGSSSPSCEYDEKVRYIRITDINDEGFLNEEFVSPKFYDEKHILEDGDVLFARTGATVGKAYCYHNEDGKCVYAGYLIRLRPNQKIVIPDYIYLCTKSKEYEDFIKTSQAAAAQPNVNAEKYGNFEIPLPPLPEQKRIVKELDVLSEKVRQLQEIYTKQIANCTELKQSLLQKAFEGEL